MSELSGCPQRLWLSVSCRNLKQLHATNEVEWVLSVVNFNLWTVKLLWFDQTTLKSNFWLLICGCPSDNHIGCPADNQIIILGCPVHVLVAWGIQTTAIWNVAYILVTANKLKHIHCWKKKTPGKLLLWKFCDKGNLPVLGKFCLDYREMNIFSRPDHICMNSLFKDF